MLGGGVRQRPSLCGVLGFTIFPLQLIVCLKVVWLLQVKSEGMEILRQEERTLTKEEAAEFYKQHEGSQHFEDLVEFMSR